MSVATIILYTLIIWGGGVLLIVAVASRFRPPAVRRERHRSGDT